MVTHSECVFLSLQIESGSVWKQVYQDLGIPVLNSAAGYNVKCAYRKYVQMLPPQHQEWHLCQFHFRSSLSL